MLQPQVDTVILSSVIKLHVIYGYSKITCSLQAAVDWPESIHIAGEIVHRGLNRTLENIDFVNKEQTDKEK